MSIGSNIKKIREQKGLLQKEVAAELGLDKSAYSKLEKDMREVKVSELQKLASLFSMSIDQIVNFEGDMPGVVTIEDKAATEQLKLISQLNDKDRTTIMSIIETMLTKQKFQNFFEENIGK